MSKKIQISIVILVIIGIFCALFSYLGQLFVEVEAPEVYEHIARMEQGANPNLGRTGFDGGDYTVDDSFVSHLPLVVIDTGKEEIPEAYTYNKEEERFVLKEGIEDPYVNGKIKVIDNENCINMLSDDASLESDMKIKYRGNSSVVYDKHQYKIELMDEEGNEAPQNVLGMGEETDWILNISMIDSSLLRNYMVYSICGQFMDYVPDVRFCEVLIKNGDSYEYEGLYMMMESIKQGTDRVDITETKSKETYSSYLVRRDRYDEEEIILNTYATENELCYGYLALRYPTASKVTDEKIAYITEDISRIEKVIFSEEEDVFMTYSEYIDEDSFVDYFLLNEFFTNYDAGSNSTYMYKDSNGKLKIGPVWDYDNAYDNVGSYLLDPTIISFHGQPWFEELIRSEEFCKKLVTRYKELRESYFSDEYISQFIDDTVAYLGNAQKRDWSRWNAKYTEIRFEILKDANGIKIDRNFVEYEDVVQRLKDISCEHAAYILPELEELKAESQYKAAYRTYTDYGVMFIAILLLTIVIIRRKRRI